MPYQRHLFFIERQPACSSSPSYGQIAQQSFQNRKIHLCRAFGKALYKILQNGIIPEYITIYANYNQNIVLYTKNTEHFDKNSAK